MIATGILKSKKKLSYRHPGDESDIAVIYGIFNLFLEPLLHGFRSLRELFRTLAGETTALEAFFIVLLALAFPPRGGKLDTLILPEKRGEGKGKSQTPSKA